MPRSNDGRWISHCKLCGKEFAQRKKSQEYCSKACSNKAFPGAGGKKPAAGLELRNCIICGGLFQPYRSTQETDSPECYRRSPRSREAQQRTNARRRNDPEVAARIRRYNREQQLARRYGLTIEEHDAKLAAQGGVCMICGQPPSPDGIKAASRLHIDHDHATGQNRDLICLNCNRGLGYFKDDPALMRTAAEYVERHRLVRHG